MPVSACSCCGCCTCEKASPNLATSYLVDLSGTWDVNQCECLQECGVGDDTYTLNQVGDCTFGVDGLTFGELCLLGYSISTSLLELAEENGCFFWSYTIAFYTDEGQSLPLYRYRQRSADCGDPTGIYDLYEQFGGVGSSVPSTVTIS